MSVRTLTMTCGAAAVYLAAAVAISACGGDETLSAQEFVDRVNDEGVKLELGETLLATDDSKELYAVELKPVSELPGSDEASSGGSMSVYDDVDGADDEMESCEASADLLCYRVANIVVVLEGGGIEAQQLGVAVQRLSED